MTSMYTTHIASILEHYRLINNLKRFEERGNYKERGFLVAEAVETQIATKVSGCHTVL